MGRSTAPTLAFLVAFASIIFFCTETNCLGLPKGFVYVEDFVPGVQIELRYFTGDNFVGQRIDGYLKHRCILTREAAQALAKVQKELNSLGLSLKIYDAYRPQRAVQHFVRWAKDLHDTRMKSIYYPHVNKEDLFAQGYIAERSSHSRGSTVDLTIVAVQGDGANVELDMGSTFDFFDPKSWLNNRGIGPGERAHRLLLQVLMKKHGFQSYPKEWWHFTFKGEPYLRTYFDFPVE